jgi:hypothetical protein
MVIKTPGAMLRRALGVAGYELLLEDRGFAED